MEEEVQTKLGFVLKPGTKWATAWAAAPAALAGFQAISAQRQLGKVRTDIDNYRRQDIENPFANLSNPYENLAVATQAAEMQMEQTDQALANTLDTLRETGAAAGGATAIANAALKSKQGVAASIEKQEAQNQRLQAQGQLQVDIAKGKGETIRMQTQENRDINELNRLQAQSDMAQYRRDSSIQTGLSALGDAAAVRNAGIVPEQRNTPEPIFPETQDANISARRNAQQALLNVPEVEIKSLGRTPIEDIQLADDNVQQNTQEAYARRLKQAQEARMVDQDINPNNKTFDETYTSLNPQSDSTKPAFTFEEYKANKLWNNDNLVAYFKKK